jgi:hypothetical protein
MLTPFALIPNPILPQIDHCCLCLLALCLGSVLMLLEGMLKRIDECLQI